MMPSSSPWPSALSAASSWRGEQEWLVLSLISHTDQNHLQLSDSAHCTSDTECPTLPQPSWKTAQLELWVYGKCCLFLFRAQKVGIVLWSEETIYRPFGGTKRNCTKRNPHDTDCKSGGRSLILRHKFRIFQPKICFPLPRRSDLARDEQDDEPNTQNHWCWWLSLDSDTT